MIDMRSTLSNPRPLARATRHQRDHGPRTRIAVRSTCGTLAIATLIASFCVVVPCLAKATVSHTGLHDTIIEDAAMPSEGNSTVGASCDGSDWAACRSDFADALYGEKIVLRPPDFVIQDTNYSMSGLPGPGAGTGVGHVTWTNNLTRLIWTIKSEHITLNSTILYSLNTSSRAPANYNPPPYAAESGPGQPDPNAPWGENTDYYPTTISDTLIIYHNGHETSSCTPNYDGVVDYFNELGYDVMEMMMPLIGCNSAHGGSHAWFEQYEKMGDHTLKFFIEPVAYAAGYAKHTLGYKHVVMVGLSGGGWTTTLASALVTDIDLSFPVAGSVPKWPTTLYPKWVPDLPEGHNSGARSPDIFHPPPEIGAGGDYEQAQARPPYAVIGGFAQMYILAALEENRHQLQILHEYDSCCFRAAGLFDGIKDYNTYVSSQTQGVMQTAVTAGNYHEVNFRDKVIIVTVVERLRRNGKLTIEDFALLPFDDLRVQ
eukprot:m.30019 g.30019  ORF g.30019 m.30019 type:complete len:486 (-) comp4656_c0_seq1:24-1481(-)